MKFWAGFTKQYKISGKIGGFKDLLMRTLFYVSIINFMLIAVTAYHTTLRDTLQAWFSWLSFPIFLGILVVGLLLMMILEYKIVLPSTWVFMNKQQYEHQNLIREQLDKIEKTLGEIQRKQGIIKDDNKEGIQGESNEPRR